MPVSSEQVAEAVRAVWAAVVGLDVRPAMPSTLPPTVRHCRTGFVPLTGGWNGAVQVAVSEPLARRAAGVLFNRPPADLPAAEVRDAVSRLADLTANKLTPLLPGPSRTGRPVVLDGSDQAVRMPDIRTVVRVPFECDGLPLAVAVSEMVPAERWWV